MAEIKFTDDQIKKLEELGGHRWTKNDMDRVYFDAQGLGLDINLYKSGNIQHAEIDGEKIAKAEARRLIACKYYIDLADGEAHTQRNADVDDENFDFLVKRLDGILASVKAMAEEEETNQNEETTEGPAMKKVIKGKLYDTSTAQEVAQAERGYPRDCDHIVETLYRKRTGEYFLHGAGGPASWAARSVGKFDRMAGEAIMPLTYDEALRWGEDNLDADEYEAVFGEVSEDVDFHLNTPISAPAKSKLEREAAKRGVTQRALIEELIGSL